ncbi:TatD family hydrolase [Chloroflexota bacterium]
MSNIMKSPAIDTHAHLDMPHFKSDLSEVISRASHAGVSTIITVGTDLESSKKAAEAADSYPEVLAAAGFHPHEATMVAEADIAELAQIAKHPRVVAIGEVGLDFYRNRAPREAQLQVLRWQLELAVELNLPVIIHCRQAENDVLTLLRDWTSRHKRPEGDTRGVIHCFSGDIDTARKYLDMDFFLSLGAYIGYPSSIQAHNVIRSIPPERLVVETDCPFLPPQSHRGKRNEPSYLPLTVKSLAEIRQVTPETVTRETTQAALHLFRLPTSE